MTITDNTANGYSALHFNTSGSSNTAIGRNALLINTEGQQNTSIGVSSGSANTIGSSNTFLGAYANASVNNLDNSTAIGSSATVNASNKMRLGNSEVTVIEGQVPWTNTSDRRLKENILYTNRLGLDFINRLQTVSYNFISDKTKTRHDGFIAQDIEAVIKDMNVPFSGLKRADDGMYSLTYSDFVMPLVNAVKELKQKNEALEERLEEMTELKKQNQIVLQRLTALEEAKSKNTQRNAEKK